MAKKSTSKKSGLDMDKFRLRSFVDRLIELDEVEVHDEATPLSELSGIIENTPKVVLFRNAGPEQVELVSSVNGSRKRMIAALGVPEDEAYGEIQRRLANPQPMVEVQGTDAPVQEVVLEGKDADLTKLPFHPQHELDGSVYLTSAIDFAKDPATGKTNVGCRRLSLRNQYETGTNVTAPSDLRGIYEGCVERGEKLPISFVIGAHPTVFMAAATRAPAFEDEWSKIGTYRGEPAPMVKSITNDIMVPADSELILEGFLDKEGYVEPEGPYGEYMGYYGPMHLDPVFHATAITMRGDVLHQSILHGSGKILGQTESANMATLQSEGEILRTLKGVIREPTRVHIMEAGGGQNVRVAIRQTMPGDARAVIAALLVSPRVKHVWVVDDDLDVFDDAQMDWAMSTRFQSNRDIVMMEGLRGNRMDLSLEGSPVGSRAGFDCTVPWGQKVKVTTQVPSAPRFSGTARFQTVRQALEAGPMFFVNIMDSVGSQDGREVAVALDALRQQGELARNADGQYFLGKAKKGSTQIAEYDAAP